MGSEMCIRDSVHSAVPPQTHLVCGNRQLYLLQLLGHRQISLERHSKSWDRRSSRLGHSDERLCTKCKTGAWKCYARTAAVTKDPMWWCMHIAKYTKTWMPGRTLFTGLHVIRVVTYDVYDGVYYTPPGTFFRARFLDNQDGAIPKDSLWHALG